jgi:DNA-binding NtrC family response regulator
LHGENIQSQLFGHRKGAYTGATESRLGCFRAGENGTVFLNEIGNIPYSLQPMLHRVVEYRVVTPMGDDEEVKVNPLMIFATNRDLEQMCAEERFMPDLLKRMQRCQMHIPPLRERKEDIPLLTDFLYRKICLKSQCGIQPKIEKGVYSQLACYGLPGNVRELENLLIAAFGIMRRNKEVVLTPRHLCFFKEKSTLSTKADLLSGECLNEHFMLQLEVLFDQELQRQKSHNSKYQSCIFDIEDHYHRIIRKFYQLTGSNKVMAAKMLGISRHKFRKFH